MSLDKEEDINTIKKGSIDIKDDQEDGNNSQNLDNNEEVVEGDQLDNLNKEIPDNSQLSDGEERPDTENKLKEEPKTDDYQTVKTKDGEEEEDQADEKEDFADVEISSGSSNAVYLSIILNVLFILSYILEFNIADANSMNFVIQKDIDEFPYSKNPYLVMKDISSLVESMSFINSVLISNIYDKSKTYAPDKYNQTLFANANYTRPRVNLSRLLQEDSEPELKDMSIQELFERQFEHLEESIQPEMIEKIKQSETVKSERRKLAEQRMQEERRKLEEKELEENFRLNEKKKLEEKIKADLKAKSSKSNLRRLAACTSDTDCSPDFCNVDNSTCYSACSTSSDCTATGKNTCSNSLCFNSPCVTSYDCFAATGSPLAQCVAGNCIIHCTSDSNCPSGKLCNTILGQCFDSQCTDDTYCTTNSKSRCLNNVCIKDLCVDTNDCLAQFYTSCFLNPNGINTCYNDPCQTDDDCKVLQQGYTTCNTVINKCLNLLCSSDDTCQTITNEYPTVLSYTKCDTTGVVYGDLRTWMCYNSPCKLDVDCKPLGLSNCNVATGTCDSGRCTTDQECQDTGYTNCDPVKQLCYSDPCKIDDDCKYQNALACDRYQQVCFNNTCTSNSDCDNYNYYFYVDYAGCNTKKGVCYPRCSQNSDCASMGLDTCVDYYGVCINNTCSSDSDCNFPWVFTNCDKPTKKCFLTYCESDEDCEQYGLNACDPLIKPYSCYNSTPDYHICVTDDDCGSLGLLAACDNERNLCVTPNPEDNSSQLYFMSSFNLFKGIVMTAAYNPSLDIPDNATTDPIFFDSTISLGKALSLYGKVQSYIQSGIVQELKIEYIFFNVVTQIGLYYTIRLGQDSYSDFYLERHVESFFPKIFDSDSVYPSLKVTLIIFRGLFAFVLIFRILKVIIVDIYKTIKTFIQTHKLNLPLPLVFNIILLILLTFVLLISLFNNFLMGGKVSSFSPPSLGDFQQMITFAQNTNLFLRLLAITIFFIVLETLLLLNTQFPSFGVLFYTLGKARKELFYFLVLVFTLIAGFMVFLVLNFGLQNDDMSDISSAFVLLFQFMIGATDFRTLAAANPNWGQIFFFLFYVVFNLVLVLIFIVIIMSTYIQLRKKLQLITLALAAIASDKSKEMKDKYWKLITCQPPQENKEAVDKSKQPGKGKQQEAETKAPEKKKNYYEILMFNLQEVDYFGFTSNNRETRAEIEAHIREKIKKIKEDRILAKEKKAEERKKGLFKKFSGMLVHIIFMVIYLSTMDLEMRLSESYDLNQAIKIQFVDQPFTSKVGGTNTDITYDEITSLDQIFDWLNNLYFPTVYSNWTKPKQGDPSIGVLFGQNYIVGTSPTRVTIRNVKLAVVGSTTNQTFYIRGPDDFDIDTPTQQGIEQIQPVEFDEFSVPRQQEGSKLTIRRHGGYSFYFLRDTMFANYTYRVMKHPKIININTNLIACQIVWGNPNLEIYGLSEFVLGIHPSGEVSTDYFFNEFELDMYSCYNCYKRAVMEVFYALIVLTQIYGLVKEWYREWKRLIPWCPSCKHSGLLPEELKEQYINMKKCPNPKCECICDEKIEAEKNKSKEKILKEFKFFPFMIAVFKKIWELTNRFMNATSAFFKKDGSNLIMTISIIFTLIGFSYLLTLVGDDFRRNSVPTVKPGLATGIRALEFDSYESLALTTRSYILWQSLNGWLIGLRLLFYFGFSRELSMVLEIVGEALFDIVFFIFMFFIILLGFAINGYLIFGLDTLKFRNLGRAIIQNLLIIISDNSSDYLVAVDKVVGLIYFFLFMGIFFMILLKMFIAILDGQFTDLNSGKSDPSGIDKMGFFELIIFLLKNNIDGMIAKVEKFTEEKKDDEEDEDPNKKKKKKHFAERAIKYLTKKLLSLIKLIKSILLGSELGEDEKNRLKKAKEKNVMNVKLKYVKNVEEEKKREENLDGLEYYIKGGVIPQKKKDEDEDADIMEEDADNEHIDILDDEKSISHKWMITLEETLLKMSGGKLQLSKFGMHSKDFSKLEGKIAPEFLIKEKELEEIENDFQIYHKLENTTFTAYFVPKIKMWYEEEIKTKFERPQFEKLIKQLYLIYQKAPVHHHHKPEVHAAEKANDSPDKKDGENGSPQQEKKETKTSNFNVEFKKTEIFPENSKIVEQELMNFMDFIKIEHKFEMWSGYKYSIVIPEDFRNFLWSSFTFTNKHFGLNPKREHSIKLNKQGSMSSLSDLDSPMKKSNADAGSLNDAEGNGNIMRAASIGSVDQIEETKEERAQRKKNAVRISNDRIIEFWMKHQSTDPMLAGSKSCIDKITKEHVELVQKMLRGPKNVYLPAEIRKFNNPKDRLKYLKKVCDDDKIILWLMTDPTTKIKMCLRMQNDVLAAFYMLLLLEEVYTNSIVVMKLEKEMNEDFKSKIYMHFFLFANFESLLHIHERQKQDDMVDQEKDMIDYIRFLENQLDSSNKLKASYLEQVQKILDEDPEAYEYRISHLDDFTSNKASGVNFLPQRESEISTNKQEDYGKTFNSNMYSAPETQNNEEESNLKSTMRGVRITTDDPLVKRR